MGVRTQPWVVSKPLDALSMARNSCTTTLISIGTTASSSGAVHTYLQNVFQHSKHITAPQQGKREEKQLQALDNGC